MTTKLRLAFGLVLRTAIARQRDEDISANFIVQDCLRYAAVADDASCERVAHDPMVKTLETARLDGDSDTRRSQAVFKYQSQDDGDKKISLH